MNSSATLNEEDERLDISKQEKIVSTFENSDSDSDEGQDTSKQQHDIAKEPVDDDPSLVIKSTSRAKHR